MSSGGSLLFLLLPFLFSVFFVRVRVVFGLLKAVEWEGQIEGLAA